MRRFSITALALIAGLVAPPAYGVERGRGGEGRSAGGHPPGGSWSAPSHHGGQSHTPHNYSQGQGQRGESGKAAGESAFNRNASQSPESNKAAGATAEKRRNESTASGAQGAAAGAAAANRRRPQASGAEDAAAGAAAANRNAPKASGAEGAAAGAALANRNAPQVTGAAGAAAGAAVANRNAPKVSGAEGAAAGAAVANRNAPAVSGAAGAVAGSAAVRSSFNNHDLFSQQWYGSNQGAWAPARWAQGTAWTPTAWQNVSTYVGAASAPSWYDYGANVNCVNGTVTLNNQPIGTAEEFSQQAASLAQTGADANVQASDEWMPLGIFAMVRNEQQHPQMIFQFAINKQGIVRGNFTDEVTEHTQPIQGAADPKTQRMAWTVGDHTTAVMEAGLSNLADGEAPALIHKNGKTDHWLLVRLQQPDPGANAAPAPGAPQ